MNAPKGAATKDVSGGGVLDGVEVVVRQLPFESAGFPDGVQPRAFTGFDVGPFFVHNDISDDGISSTHDGMGDWCITHLQSGFSAQKGIPNHARALWLARKLAEFDVWHGDTKDQVRANIPDDLLAQIKVLRADATSGDCQGEYAALSEQQS